MPFVPSCSASPRRRVGAALLLATASAAAEDLDGLRLATHTLERVDVTADRPTSLPIEIPTTTEGVTRAQIERGINATDAEDALKYLPSLLVRRRYIGDYDHAVLATRASGTGNSARSLVYADGILLSNLLGNGASYTPRWGLVTPEEIERVDVLYGPFSAAYPGNSAGAIVDYVTRMPKKLEAHVKLQAFTQPYRLYGTDDRYSGAQASASLGSRAGAWSWWVNVNHLDSDAQPIGFATRLVSQGTAGGSGTSVDGAVAGSDPRNRPWLLFGTTGQTHTVQDHGKLKLAWDATQTLRVSYTAAVWRNDAQRLARSFVRDAAGKPVASGPVVVDGRAYTLAASDLASTQADQTHVAQGLSLKQHTGGAFDWEAVASRYRYEHDRVGTATLDGTGWDTLALKGTWRGGPHVVEAGLQRDAFRLRQRVGDTGSFAGRTALTSLWAQDAWRFAPEWRAVLGLRLERWQARGGAINGVPVPGDERDESHASPKAALSYRVDDHWTLKASLGRAVRMPTVSELYQGTTDGRDVFNNDPNLRPEKSWTSELSAERQFDAGRLRATLFLERTLGALYTQALTSSVSTVQNVGAIRTRGAELAAEADDALVKGLSLQGSLTYADSIIVRNDANPASVGRWQPRVPRWRATAFASYAFAERWTASLGARYSGRQYGQLDNSDTNDFAYTGFSRFLVVDARLQWRLAPQWTASAGIDNLNNRTYWAFHPYPQRSFHAELRWDL